MGGCASTQHQQQQQHHPVKPHRRSQQLLLLLSPSKKSNPPPPESPPRRAEIVRVICEDGRVEEFSSPVTAEAAIGGKGCGGSYLCSWESMYVDAWAPEVAPEEELKQGQVYFVMPKSKANEPMSLHQMCALAIKASSALSLQDFHSSFRR